MKMFKVAVTIVDLTILSVIVCALSTVIANAI